MKTLARPQDKAELLSRLTRVSAQSQRRWGKMSPHQMICHLSDAFRMAIERKPVSPASGLLQRTLVKWIALYVPVRWPAGIDTRPEIDQECDGTRPSDFAADVAQLQALLERVAVQAKGTDWPPHPIFGAMSEGAWLRWGYLHMDHHLRQFGA